MHRITTIILTGVCLTIVAPATGRAEAPIGVFTSLEWRGLRLADHNSHGPGMAAGVVLFGGHLRVGLAAFSRPGPLNSETFAVGLDGETYRGKSTVDLRSDGAFVGLVVAPRITMSGAPWLSLEAPVALGQSGFGFYLSGDDRKTPDGRRVSAWENDLLGGKDSSFNIGLDLGVRASAQVARDVRIYVGLSQYWAIGYDTLITDNYSGPTVAVGLELGRY